MCTTPDGVRFDDLGDRLVLTATRDLTDVATRWFASPAVSVPLPIVGLDRGLVELAGFAYTQFAMPVRAVGGRPFDFAPAHNLNSPPAVLPLLIRTDEGRVCLLAPIDSWHEQIVSVEQTADGITALRWGWHGDLDTVTEGFTTTLSVTEGDSAAELLADWGAQIRSAAGTRRPASDADPVVTHLSYWTDNGAAYWYRTEPGLDLVETLGTKLDELRRDGVPIRAVELDSWFYPHEILRPVTDVGYPAEVPPTGMMTWSARPDVLSDGVEGLARRLGDPPLVLHSRHISPDSPYLDEGEWWTDLLAAQPVDPSFFDRWFADAARWGATCIEQDWMMIVWFGVRELRSAPSRALEWQRALDRSAGDHGLHLLWCMATPGDLCATVELERVVAVRTSDDYRFAADPAILWHWYLTVNRLADALDLRVFKDCFFSVRRIEDDDSGQADTELDGDPYPEIEALLSAMSGGVVGIGDRIGRTDPEVIARCCRPDGLLVGPDHPIAIDDDGLFLGRRDDAPTWATTSSGPWWYVVALHTGDNCDPVHGSFDLGAETLVYDWRRGTAAPASSIDIELGHRDWALLVCCPMHGDVGTRQALIGDPGRYATMGSSRVAVDGGSPRVLLAPGESPVALRWWIEGEGIVDR